jgi:hypothetical protein
VRFCPLNCDGSLTLLLAIDVIFSTPDIKAEWTKVWTQLLDECSQNGIVTVIPAGNTGFSSLRDLSDFVPQGLATSTSSTIVVGGVFSDGHFSVNTTLDFEQGPPAIGVYAQSSQVFGASGSSDTENVQYDGTSFASPAVVSVLNF